MYKIFISGSRSIKFLYRNDRKILDKIIEHNITVLVGDADGIDSLVQKYFYDKEYTNVIVYHMFNKCRNNIGNFKTKSISLDKPVDRYKFYTIKDIAMSEDCDAGFMIWDGKSNGVKNNRTRLNKLDKMFLVHKECGTELNVPTKPAFPIEILLDDAYKEFVKNGRGSCTANWTFTNV